MPQCRSPPPRSRCRPIPKRCRSRRARNRLWPARLARARGGVKKLQAARKAQQKVALKQMKKTPAKGEAKQVRLAAAHPGAPAKPHALPKPVLRAKAAGKKPEKHAKK